MTNESRKRTPFRAFNTAYADALNDKQFDALVDGWNRISPSARRLRARECSRGGHQFKTVIFDGKPTYVVCTNCLKYDNDRLEKRSKGMP